MLKIKNKDVIEDIVGGIADFPKYTTQLINLANQNSGGTRPSVVGQMSELIQECPGACYEDWVKWYQEQKPSAIEDATAKILAMLDKMKTAFELINKEMVERWVKDLVHTKTYTGLNFQKSILKRLSQKLNTTYQMAKPDEEARGIDGYIGERAVSVKPITYNTKEMLGERIDASIIFYEKVKDGIKVTWDF